MENVCRDKLGNLMDKWPQESGMVSHPEEGPSAPQSQHAGLMAEYHVDSLANVDVLERTLDGAATNPSPRPLTGSPRSSLLKQA